MNSKMTEKVSVSKKNNDVFKNGTVIISSFLVSSLLILFILAVKGIVPFGNNTVLVGDVKNQYLPFFQFYKTALSDGKITTFQPDLFLGWDYYGIFSYYLMSPFNLICLLFPINMMPEALCFMIILKIGMCGGCFASYLCFGPFKGNGLRYVLLSCSYALMSWTMICFQNIIWLDGIYILPLMALGAERLLNRKKGGLFIITTFLSILFNFYIAWFNVVFISVYFLIRLILSGSKPKEFFRHILGFMFCGICSGGTSAFFLIPVIHALSEGKGNNENYVNLKYRTADLLSVFKSFLPQSYGGTYLDSAPFVFAGSVILILCVCYMVFVRGGLRPRFVFLGVFLFYILSFTLYPLNSAWHGFARPAMIPSRFSYTFTFFLIMFAEFGAEALESSGAVLKLRDKYASLVKLLTFVACFYTFFELYLNGSFLLGKTLEEQVFGIKDEYIRVADTTGYMLDCGSYDDSFRTYDNQIFSLNDGMLFDYRMVSGYSSVYPGNLSRFYKRIGIGVSRSYDCILRDVGMTPVMARILAVRNIIVNDSVWGYDLAENNGYAKMYTDPDTFSPIYTVSGRCLEHDNKDILNASADPFTLQNTIVSDICGSDIRLFDITEFDSDNPDGSDNGLWICTSHQKGMLWMFVPFDSDKYDVPYQYEALVNEELSYRFNVNNMQYCICLGEYEEDEPVTVRISDDGNLGEPVFAFLNADDLNAFAEEMSGNMAKDVEILPSGVRASIGADADGPVLFTYPYSSGMKLFIDGRETDPDLYMGVFPVALMTAGTHLVELKYTIPGIGLGLSVSVIFIIIMVVYGLGMKFFRKNENDGGLS